MNPGHVIDGVAGVWTQVPFLLSCSFSVKADFEQIMATYPLTSRPGSSRGSLLPPKRPFETKVFVLKQPLLFLEA